MHVEEFWESRAIGPVLGRIALLPLAGLYAIGWECYLAWYKLGLKRAKMPHPRTLCIGNLVVGGVGKTPTVVFVAQQLLARGHRVVISSSGYGGPMSTGAQLAPEGPILASAWGDEPALFREELPDVPIIVGRDRLAAATIAGEQFADSILVMDDGFQHLPVAKRVSVVLDPPRRNRLCLPAGPYREPRWRKRRADLVIPGDFRVVANPLEVESVAGAYALLSAIGQPERFLQSLLASGKVSGPPAQDLRLPDHDDLQAGNLLASVPVDMPIITTQKDWVKLRERSDIADRKVIVARHSVRVEPSEGFLSWIEERLNDH
jgi:tetraacyldisaccharide 4'-kinase